MNKCPECQGMLLVHEVTLRPPVMYPGQLSLSRPSGAFEKCLKKPEFISACEELIKDMFRRRDEIIEEYRSGQHKDDCNCKLCDYLRKEQASYVA